MIKRSIPSALRPGLFLLASLLVSPNYAHGGDRRRVLAVSPPSSELRLAIVGAAMVDAGSIVWRGGAKRSAAAVQVVTLRIGEPSRESRGTATLRAFVETFDPRCTVRIDGVALTTAPRIVRRRAPIGVPFTHRIEIEVPVTAADGPLQTDIRWEITTE